MKVKGDIKDLAILTGAAVAGNAIAEMYLIRSNGSGGVVDLSPGFGMDDVVRGLAVAGATYAAFRIL